MRPLVAAALALAAARAAALGPEPVSLSEQCRASRCVAPPARRDPSDGSGSCASYAPQRPFPALYNGCEDAYGLGHVFGCTQGCESGDRGVCFGLPLTAAFRQAQEAACKPVALMAPRPALGDACKRGFEAGATEACSASHHWAAAEVRRQAEASASARAAAEAASLAAMEAQLERTRAAAEEARRLKAAAEAAAAAEAQRAAQEKARLEAEAREAEAAAKKGRTRGMPKAGK